jgi:hypothetical protein
MHTMLHMDGSQFMLTHYCAMRNQPRMVLVPGRDPNKLVFEFKDGRNIKPGDVYMNRVAFTIDGPNHHTEDGPTLKTVRRRRHASNFAGSSSSFPDGHAKESHPRGQRVCPG